MKHTPVLLKEVIATLNPQPHGRYIDATVGDGGHTAALLEHSSPSGQVLGLDQDVHQLAVAQTNLAQFGDRVHLVCSRFSALSDVAQAQGFGSVDGILLDLGFSSRQLADTRYGLDYLRDASNLDMRLSGELAETAADFLNQANETEIADVLYGYGDRHNSRHLAKQIVAFRRKKRFQVARDLKDALGVAHPSALAPIFQALRIWVNQEYEEIKAVIPQAIELLKPGGKLAIITFHSGEDRVVKREILAHRSLLEVSKIIQPTYQEIKTNVRARSAKLRVATKQIVR